MWIIPSSNVAWTSPSPFLNITLYLFFNNSNMRIIHPIVQIYTNYRKLNFICNFHHFISVNFGASYFFSIFFSLFLFGGILSFSKSFLKKLLLTLLDFLSLLTKPNIAFHLIWLFTLTTLRESYAKWTKRDHNCSCFFK